MSAETKTETVKTFFKDEWDGETHREIADMFGVSQGTVQRGKDEARGDGWREQGQNIPIMPLGCLAPVGGTLMACGVTMDPRLHQEGSLPPIGPALFEIHKSHMNLHRAMDLFQVGNRLRGNFEIETERTFGDDSYNCKSVKDCNLRHAAVENIPRRSDDIRQIGVNQFGEETMKRLR